MNEEPKDSIFEIEVLYCNIFERFFSLNKYFNEISTFVETRTDQFYRSFKNNSELSDDTNYEYDQNIISWGQYIIPHFKTTFISALITAFEISCNEICDTLANLRKIPIRRTDLQGSVIKSFKKYLATFAHFKNLDHDLWYIVETITIIRNIIVHGGGDINKANVDSKKRLFGIQKMDVGFSLHHRETINLIWRNNKTEDCKNASIRPKSDLLGSTRLNKTIPKNVAAISFSGDFCYFALSTFVEFFKMIEKEHLKLLQWPRVVK